MRMKNYLLELQYRFFIIFLNFFFNFLILYIYKEEVIYLFSFQQEENSPYFISTHLTEIFLVHLKISIILSFYFTYPLTLIQLSLFLNPALYNYESKNVKNYVFIALLLYSICLMFTYMYFIPYCWKFFSSFQSPIIHYEAKFNSYTKFFIESIFLLQFLFQFLGFFLFFIPHLRPSFYKFSRKTLYFSFLFFSTLLTPPDVYSQLLVSSIFIFIYETFVFFYLLSKEYKRASNGT